MWKRLISVYSLSFFLVFSLFSQEKDRMKSYERKLDTLFEKVFNEPTDNERYNANEQAVQLLNEALDEYRSFFWKWDDLKKRVSILESADKKLKIFTWAIQRDNGEFECFGMMQVLNEKNSEYEVVLLEDKSDEIQDPEEAVLSSKDWYGMVYYELITNKTETKTYYTLLGWSGNNQVYQKKVIETLSFRSSSIEPQFGQSIFHKEKKRKRVLFCYAKDGNMLLRYGMQHYVEKKKIKKSRKDPLQIVETKIEEAMIVFDLLEPQLEGLEGLPQYYFPSGQMNGYIFQKNRWELRKDIEPRNKKDKKVDKAKPYKKKPSVDKRAS